MKSFYTDVIKKDPRYNSHEAVKDMSLVEPGTRAAVLALVADAQKAGHDLRVQETYRSQARQAYLYSQGFTQLHRVGCHGYGLAVDFSLYVNGKYEGDGQKYMFLVPLAKKHGLISGYDWGTPKHHHSFHDYDHVQRCAVFRQGALFAGTWYPDEHYDPYADQRNNGITI